MSPFSSNTQKLLFFIFVLFSNNLALSQRYNALFNLGDSFSDTGNVRISKLPYGITYFNKTTGRCSDGRLVIDHLAAGLGLPFLKPSSSRDVSFHQGANFAFTGATTLDFKFFNERNLGQGMWVNASVQTQVEWFQKMLPSLCTTQQDCKDFLSRSLFIVGEFGGNDYTTGLFAERSVEEVTTYVPHVVKAIADGVERLIELGAVDIIVPNILPIGCFPLYLARFYRTSSPDDFGPNTGCLRKFNALSWYHNVLLRRAVDKIKSKYSDSVVLRYADYYSQVMDFVLDPLKYGFTDGAMRSCCGHPGVGTYNFHIGFRCAENGSIVCDNPSTHVSWDGIHFTDAANGVIAQGWLHGPYIDPPILGRRQDLLVT